MYSTQTDILIRPTKGQVDATGSAFHPHHHPQIFCFVLVFFFFFFFFKPVLLGVLRFFVLIGGVCWQSQRRGGLFKNESFNRFIIHKCCRQTGRQAGSVCHVDVIVLVCMVQLGASSFFFFNCLMCA